MIKKVIKVPLYFQWLTIIQTDDFEYIEKKFKLTKSPVAYDAVVFTEDKNPSSIVAVFNTKVTPSIIAHESVHICNTIFYNVGIQKDLLNDEPEAYLVGWLVDQIHLTIKVPSK